ncbi:MAG: ATP-binding protein [Acidobacteriota bacterium]|nr:ATP-binding protein [Acidobacteriota bacterium]
MYIRRLLEKTYLRALKSFPAVFVGGPRRSGKTTLVKRFGAGMRYVLLDELDVRAFAAEDPRGFLDAHPPPVIIDEIQNVPELLPYIKARIDADNKPGRWILTGSQQWALMKGIGETLAGRIAVLHLYPFAITEILERTSRHPEEIEGYLDSLTRPGTRPGSVPPAGEWLLQGGYPEVVIGDAEARKLWFSGYVQTYIDRDVRGNIKDANLRDYERFVRLLAARTAQPLNASTLAGDVGVTVPTIKAWLALLEASGLIFFLTPYYKNFGKRVVKAPKCYVMDTGLVCYLVGLADGEAALRGPMGGALFETAVVSQFFKRLSAIGEERALHHFRSHDGLEIDLLIERPDRLIPIEIKLSSTIAGPHLRGLKKWMELSGDRQTTGFVVSTSGEPGFAAARIRTIPYFLL